MALVDQHGRPCRWPRLRGKVVVLAPFLSLCQDECPLVTGAFISLQRDLRAAGLAHRVVFVEATVDPGRDTVARLAAYQKEFGADWDLWTGTPANIAAFWKPFGVAYQIVPEEQPPKIDWWTGTAADLRRRPHRRLHPHRPRRPRALRRRRRARPGGALEPMRSFRGLLDDGGLHDLRPPAGPDWTTADALARPSAGCSARTIPAPRS